MSRHVVVTGAAGYIGSLLVGELLRLGYQVSAVDTLIFGGDALLAYAKHEHFHFEKGDVCEPKTVLNAVHSGWKEPDAVVHLAGIVGFPACQAVGRQVAWKYNVEATQRVFEQTAMMGAKRFIFPSTYSNYALLSDGSTITEETALTPNSLFTETKIAAERFLTHQRNEDVTPIIFRLATLFGVSPRMRFDLLINQFVLDAFSRRELLIYQRGYRRSFVHVFDVVRGIVAGLEAGTRRIEQGVYNLGSEAGNFSKDDIVAMILERLPETNVRYKDVSFGGDVRDLAVSFEKIRDELDFEATHSVKAGVREVLMALKAGYFYNPQDARFRNAQFIIR